METVLSDRRMKHPSGHVNDGAISGTTDIAGHVGRARHFNAGDRITSPAIQVLATDFAVAGWFRWTTNPSPYYAGIQGGGDSWELRVMADGRFGATFYQSTTVWTEIVSPLAYNDGTWHHAAAVLRLGLVELYVDGLLVAQDTTNPIAFVHLSTQTIVGQIASDLFGVLCELLVFSRALTAQEISSIESGSAYGGRHTGRDDAIPDFGACIQACSPLSDAATLSKASSSHSTATNAVMLSTSGGTDCRHRLASRNNCDDLMLLPTGMTFVLLAAANQDVETELSVPRR